MVFVHKVLSRPSDGYVLKTDRPKADRTPPHDTHTRSARQTFFEVFSVAGDLGVLHGESVCSEGRPTSSGSGDNSAGWSVT